MKSNFGLIEKKSVAHLLICSPIPKVTTRPISTMYLEKLENYFPRLTIRELDRCNYKVPKDAEQSDEVKILRERILYV